MKQRWISIATALALAVGLQTASAAVVVTYEWTEGGAGQGTTSTHVSRHGTRGPVVADDFIPAVSGRVVRVDWWGSAAIAGSPDPDAWEITFHSNVGGTPSNVYPTGVLRQHIVSSSGSDSDGDGVHLFSASWTPTDLMLTAGTAYWFSAANFQCTQLSTATTGPACLAGWTWADAGGAGPTVGAESFAAVNSYGVAANGGPHFGPWNTLYNAAGAPQDLAFRVWVEVPEPGTLALLGFGLAGLAASRRRKQ